VWLSLNIVILVAGRRYESVVQVRRKSVAAFVNGVLILKYETDYHDLTMEDYWALHDSRALGLGAQETSLTFHCIEVSEIAGQGRLTRSMPAKARGR
jgi:hypothetical protein